MHTTQSNEQYTDRGNYAVMTRTTVLKYAQLARIADHLCRNAEDLVSSMNPPSTDSRRIAGTMLGWAYKGHWTKPLRGTRLRQQGVIERIADIASQS